MGCIPSKSKVLSQDAGPQGAAPAASTKSTRTKKTQEPSQDMGPPPPWVQTRAKLVLEKDGSVQFKPTS